MVDAENTVDTAAARCRRRRSGTRRRSSTTGCRATPARRWRSSASTSCSPTSATTSSCSPSGTAPRCADATGRCRTRPPTASRSSTSAWAARSRRRSWTCSPRCRPKAVLFLGKCGGVKQQEPARRLGPADRGDPRRGHVERLSAAGGARAAGVPAAERGLDHHPRLRAGLLDRHGLHDEPPGVGARRDVQGVPAAAPGAWRSTWRRRRSSWSGSPTTSRTARCCSSRTSR